METTKEDIESIRKKILDELPDAALSLVISAKELKDNFDYKLHDNPEGFGKFVECKSNRDAAAKTMNDILRRLEETL